SARLDTGGSTAPPRSCPAVRPDLSFPYPRKRKVFRCFLVVFPFPQISHCSSHASIVVGYVCWMMCPTLLAASWISCCACLSPRWLRKWSDDRSEPVIHSCV